MATAAIDTVTQTPTSPAFVELKSRVAGYVQSATDGEELAIAGQAINSAIDYLNTRPWFWNYKSDDITLVADTQTYDLENDVKKPRKMQLLNSSSEVASTLPFMDPKTFWDTFYSQDSSGTPEAYTIISLPNNGNVTFSVPTSSSFIATYPTARLHYMARIAHMTDGSTWPGPPEVGLFLLWYGRWEIATTHGTTAQIDRAFAQWRGLWRDLVKDDNNVETDF